MRYNFSYKGHRSEYQRGVGFLVSPKKSKCSLKSPTGQRPYLSAKNRLETTAYHTHSDLHANYGRW